MADLSPAAQAVLAAITQQQYSLDPGDIPNEAGRMACIAAAALRAVAYQVAQPPFNTQSESDVRALLILHQIKAIAAELES